MLNLKANEKLIRARIQLLRRSPFFGNLSLHLKFDESKDLPDWAGAGVDAEGNFVYKPEFIDKLSNEETIGLVLHEVLHLAFLHLLRNGDRDRVGWNIAADIVSNSIIKLNNFELPEGCLVPNDNNEVELKTTTGPLTIQDVNKKTAEQIYDELKKELIKRGGTGEGDDGEGLTLGFDEHQTGKNGKTKGGKDAKQVEKDWISKVEDAAVGCKMKGDLPLGVEQLLGKLHESKINWRTLLQRYIQSYIPYDYTWTRPSKKSISADFYMPDLTKERISIIVGIDTSGSIGGEELSDFLSEIVGVAKNFRNRISIRLLTHDVSVHNDYVIENGNIEKIQNLKIDGGGGTSHQPIFDYIQKLNDSKNKAVIFLTDGCSDIQQIDLGKYNFDKIFVISKGGDLSQDELKGTAKIIKLGDN